MSMEEIASGDQLDTSQLVGMAMMQNGPDSLQFLHKYR